MLNATKDVDIIARLKNFSKFFRTLKTLLFNCKINLIWHSLQIFTKPSTIDQATTFPITNIKLCVSVVTFSIEVNAVASKITIYFYKKNWLKKYKFKVGMQAKNNI